MGLHLNVPETQVSDAAAREHRVRVWWTAYCFDRMWASRLGHPVAIQNDFIEVNLPSDPIIDTASDDFADSAYIVASIRIARLSAHMVHSIYTRKPQQKTLSQRVQESLKDLRTWVEELPPHLHIESTDTPDPSPRPLSLHLYFNQVRKITLIMMFHRTYIPSVPSPPRALFFYTYSEHMLQHGLQRREPNLRSPRQPLHYQKHA